MVDSEFSVFGLPLLIIAPFLGVNPAPADLTSGALALISLVLSASLGFAMDLLFAAFAMFLKMAAGWQTIYEKQHFPSCRGK